MDRTAIIEALAAADLAIRHGKPLALSERASAVAALGAVKDMPAAERIAIHEEVKATAAICAGA